MCFFFHSFCASGSALQNNHIAPLQVQTLRAKRWQIEAVKRIEDSSSQAPCEHPVPPCCQMTIIWHCERYMAAYVSGRGAELSDVCMFMLNTLKIKGNAFL